MDDLPDPTGPLDPEWFRVQSERWKAWAAAYSAHLQSTQPGTTAGQWAAQGVAEDVARNLWGISGWLERDAEVRRGK